MDSVTTIQQNDTQKIILKVDVCGIKLAWSTYQGLGLLRLQGDSISKTNKQNKKDVSLIHTTRYLRIIILNKPEIRAPPTQFHIHRKCKLICSGKKYIDGCWMGKINGTQEGMEETFGGNDYYLDNDNGFHVYFGHNLSNYICTCDM